MPNRLAQELRQRSDDELLRDLEGAHEELFTLRFQAATRQLADVSKIRKTRRQIARLRTLLQERGRALDGAPSPPGASAEEPAAVSAAVDEE